jgi:hypothetical protein
MPDKPMLFSAPMVRALLDGRKRQTRRMLKLPKGFRCDDMAKIDPHLFAHLSESDPQRWGDNYADDQAPMSIVSLPPYAPGDRLWVREAWRSLDGLDPMNATQIARQCVEEAGYRKPWAPIQYEADGQRVNWYEVDPGFGVEPGRLRPSIHMARWASRLTLTVTDVRVQRLQEISAEDCAREGVEISDAELTNKGYMMANRIAFQRLWNSLHGPDAWDRNDWVAAISFDVNRCNIDKMGAS